MSERQDHVCYGAIPFRALRDRCLFGIPLVLLGIIAAHDRFGKNGQGCYASHRRLAELVGCAREVVTKALLLLEEQGYVQCETAEHDRRLRSYKVLYTDGDVQAFQGRPRQASGVGSRNRARNQSQEPANRRRNRNACSREIGDLEITDPSEPIVGAGGEIGDVQVTDLSEIGVLGITDLEAADPPKTQQTSAPADDAHKRNIFSEAEINIAEAGSAMRLVEQPHGRGGTARPMPTITEAERRQSFHARMQAIGVSREVRGKFWKDRARV